MTPPSAASRADASYDYDLSDELGRIEPLTDTQKHRARLATVTICDRLGHTRAQTRDALDALGIIPAPRAGRS